MKALIYLIIALNKAFKQEEALVRALSVIVAMLGQAHQVRGAGRGAGHGAGLAAGT